MSFRYLDKDGAVSFWTNIKNYILSKIPTKTSELNNDSGFLTQHQSLSNYVTLNSEQTITGKKLFTNATTKVNSVNTFIGSTQFIDLSTTVPRGSFPESGHRVGRVYIGDNTSYNGAWFIIDPTIDTDKAYYRMVTTSPDNTDSTRFSITWDSTKEGARRRRLVCMGDLICATNNTYQIGESGNVWKDAYINNVHGISDYTNFLTSTLNTNTTLTHASNGRRTILAMGSITLTVPAPEEGSWFLIKAVNGLVTLNLTNNVTVTGITAGAFSGPIHLQPNESILLCYYSSTTYNATISTIRRSGVAGRIGTVPAENPKHWFKIAENYVTATYRDPFICLRVFESTTGNTIGTLCAHCRINNTVGVVDTSNSYLQWQDAGAGIDLSKYALTTNETSGTGVTISLWCKLEGGYSSVKFEVVSEYGQSDQLGNPEWVLTRRRQTDGDLAELLDTDFTKIVYSTLTTLKNDTTGTASNVTGTVAIANGGTGATTRLSAVKALTNEAVASPTHFLTITTNWGKAGYTNVAQAKTALGITGDMGSHSDSEYVHMSGDETIGGNKTFSNNIAINGTYLGTEASGNERTNIYLLANRDTAGTSGAYIGRFRQNRTQGAMESSDVSYITFDFLENSTRYTRCFTMGMTDWDNDKVPQTYYLTSPDGKGSLGTATNAWNKVYANSYYLGTTSFTDKFVTTDTAQTITGVKTFNSDTLVANQGNAYRIANSAGTGYGVLQRMDGTYWYMLVTANNDPLGTWTSARPITIRLSDGYCTINGKANEANKVQATIAAGTTTALVQATVASNDCFRIAAGGAANAGWAEIATGDDANEPIYVRQYKGSFTTLQRTATLLDGSGNTSFPGTVTATGFSGPLTGNVTGTASKATGNANGNEITDTVIKGLSISGKTITYTKIDGNTGTLTTQDTVYTHPTTSGNKHIPSGGSSGQFLGWDSDGTAKWVNNPNTNTDTLMTQNVSTTDSTYPILLCATANATSNQGAKTGIFGSGVKVNPKTSVVSAKGFSGIPTGNTYVSAVKDGGALVNSQATSWGAIWRAPTKDYQVAGATWSNTNNNVYICYSVTNANADAGTNTMAKSLIWAADTGTLTTTTFSGALSGNASTATEFSANKDVTLTGDVTGTASSKAGWSVATTLANSGVTAGTYGPSADVTGSNNATILVPEITVDSKGRVTSVTNRTLTCKNNTYNVYNKTLTIQKNGTNVATFTSNSNTNVTANITVPTKTSELTNDSNFLTTSSSLNASKLTGTIDIARLPQGALERVITVADQTARFALTTSSVQLGDTVKQLDTGVMYVVVNESKLNSNDGYLEYTAGSASSVPWSGITSKPTEFTPSSHTHTKSEITDFPTNVSAFTNDSGYLTSHQSLSNYVTLNTAQEITNAKTFKDTTTARKLTSVEAGNVIPSSDKLISDIWQDKNGKELGRIYYVKSKSGTTELVMRAGDWFTSNNGVYTLDASGTNRRAELHLYTDSSGNCCIKPVGYFSATLKPLNSSVLLGEYGNPFGSVYANQFRMSNPSLEPNVDVQTNEEHSIGFYGKNNIPLSYITFQKRINLKDRIAVRIQTVSSSYVSYDFDAEAFYPESSNGTQSIGTSTNRFNNCYCNNYYLGTTAFGDIVTHNASEFLTSHQSLSNYVTLDGTQTIAGTKTFSSTISGSISGNAGTATQFSANTTVALTGDATGTSAGSKKGWSVPVTLANSGVTAGSYGPATAASPAHGGTFSVPYVTVDAKGRVTAASTVTITLPADSNTDTKVTQTVTNDNACYPLLIANTASASHTGLEPTTETDEVRKAYNINVQARYGFIYARNSYNHDNLKGSVAGGNRTSAAFYGSTYDGATVGGVELGRVDKYGNRYSRLYATNHITDGALAPDGTAVAATFDVGVLADGTKYLNTSAGWYCNVYPTLDNTRTLGTASLKWSNVYATTFTGDLVGNATTATEFYNNQSVTLTGDVTGTASSKAGWSVSTTLSNSGVTAGTYGPSADVTGTNNTTILVPEITVDAKGRVTAVTNRTYTSVNSDSDKKVYQYYKSDNNVYRLLFSNNSGNTATSNVGAVYSGLNNSFYVNPSTGALYATKLYSNGVEVLTSHQSLSSCVKNVVTNNQTIKSTAITRGTAPSSAQTFGIAFTDNNNKYIGNIYGQFATDKSTYVGLYAYKGATTSNGDNAYLRVGYDASGNVYTSAPTPATTDNSTQIATTAFVKAQGYLTSHQSLANYVTTNTDQTISGVKSFSDNISTKKIISNVAQLQINARSSADSVAIIAGANASDGSGIWLYGKDNATGSDCRIQIYNTTKSRYERVDLVGSQFLPNPSGELDCGGTSNKWKSVYATNYYYGNDNVEFSTKFVTTDTDQSISGIKSHSKHISILGDYVGNEASTNSRSCLYLKANRDTDGKSGLYVTKFRQNVAQGSMGSGDVVFLSHDILENETRTNAGFVESYSNWANNVPGGMSIYSTIATRNLGTSAKPWTNAYITNLNLNGHAFDPASTSGNIGDIVFAGAYFRAINGTYDLGLMVSGNALYLADFTGAALVFSASTSNLPGTWASLGKGKPATTTENGGAMYTCLWKRIA